MAMPIRLQVSPITKPSTPGQSCGALAIGPLPGLVNTGLRKASMRCGPKATGHCRIQPASAESPARITTGQSITALDSWALLAASERGSPRKVVP